ncbi:hypothetical protein ASG67_03135 [Sphingomonas sp. Leaf339]|nr:hypothetical protein ASG67_03135 [Sphingomonas sp. Leaf339]
MIDLPWRGPIAGAQPDDDIADADRVTRLHRQFAAFAVPLVQQTQHRDPVCHRRGTSDRRLRRAGI